VAVLRDIAVGTTAELIVSRQTTVKDYGFEDESNTCDASKEVAVERSNFNQNVSSSVKSNERVVENTSHVSKVQPRKSVESLSNTELKMSAIDSTHRNGSAETPSFRETFTRYGSKAVSSSDDEIERWRTGKLKGDDGAEMANADTECLTFNIALPEAVVAGLGITVQSVSERGRDLGIAIKSVVCGGAVSKV